MGDSLALRIGAFAAGFRPADLTAIEARLARRALLDTLACALGGLRDEATAKALAYARRVSGPSAATIWGGTERLGLEQAAFVNAVAAHVLDYDDVTPPLRGHPSVAMLPALVALAEAEGRGMDDLAAAYSVGFEVMCRIARCMAAPHYAAGWHSTASIGVLGATAACANLLRLPAKAAADALGLAVAQAAGSRENFGTMAKSFQAGHANRAALQSVLLAREGFDAGPAILEGARGFMALYGKGEDLAAALDGLGAAPRELERSGIEVKKYPMCYAAHRTLDALLDLTAETGVGLGDVESAEVTGSHQSFVPLLHARPITGLEAKFSMEYAVAAALADGRVTLASFEDAAVQRPEIQAFLPRITKSEAPGTLVPRWAEVVLRLKGGGTLRRRAEALRGSAQLPFAEAELTAKLADCLAHADLPPRAEALAGLVLDAADRPVSDVVSALVA